MRVKKVTLTNFRNYAHAQAQLSPERNILLGDNAQGKSNFLEAVEILANGYSQRAALDSELIKKGADKMQIELSFESAGRQETLALSFQHKETGPNQLRSGAVEKSIQVNGVTYATMRKLRGRLATVSFKSEDLGLLRAGPKFRRDWLDRICLSLRPSLHDKISRYQKVLVQRNQLLKRLFEQGKVTTAQKDELMVWDEQVASYGGAIIYERLIVLQKLLPEAKKNQALISAQCEELSLVYQLREKQPETLAEHEDNGESPAGFASQSCPVLVSEDAIAMANDSQSKGSIDEKQLAQTLLGSLKASRYEEISRRQTLFGPHRDDISFLLNGQQATAFASQGQQRSLVLSLKLAELRLVTDCLQEPPVLILDDVLAELDLHRQTLLMSLVKDEMQTLISTTHLNGFQPQWLEKALFIEVEAGRLKQASAIGEYEF